MEWVVGIQLDADSRIIYVHMDDLKRCAPPDPEPTWPDAARGTSVVVSTRAPSTLTLSDATRNRTSSGTKSHYPRVSAHPDSVMLDMRAPSFPALRDSAHHNQSSGSGQIDMRAPNSVDLNVMHDIDTSSTAMSYPSSQLVLELAR